MAVPLRAGHGKGPLDRGANVECDMRLTSLWLGFLQEQCHLVVGVQHACSHQALGHSECEKVSEDKPGKLSGHEDGSVSNGGYRIAQGRECRDECCPIVPARCALQHAMTSEDTFTHGGE